MKLIDNMVFKVGLYNIGDYFRKYHNGLMFNEDFDQQEIMQDTQEIKKEIDSIIKIFENNR